MGLYTIGDLHLSFDADKKMDVFGGNWVNYTEKIKTAWERDITKDDTVFLLGDVSWGLKQQDAMKDLEWINELPGKKVFIKGNHDLWWNTTTKLNTLFDNMTFMQNTFVPYGEYALCGSRGWVCPGVKGFNEHDLKIYMREIGRLSLSLKNAKDAGFEKYIVGLHFPPTNEKAETSGFIELIKEYGVEKVLYGHLHDKDAQASTLQGEKDGTEYIFAACDYLNCVPKRVL